MDRGASEPAQGQGRGAAPAPADAPSRWHGSGLIARSVRFAATVMGPIAAALVFGVSTWLIFAMVTSILAYTLDTGGPAPRRLAWMAGAGAVVLLGAGIGTLLGAHHGLIIAGFALVGAFYALVESLHPTAAAAARFLCLSFAVGALYLPVAPADVAVVAAAVLYAFAVSLGWDLAIGGDRPSTAPYVSEIVARIRATSRERWRFALAVAITVPLASLAVVALGLHRPYWTLIAILIVLRADALSSGRLMVELLAGTLIGIAVAVAYGALASGHHALLAGMLAAALVRWPANELHGALGTAALTVFIMLLMELVAGSVGRAAMDMEARLIDVAVGCGFAALALAIDRLLRLLLPPRGASPEAAQGTSHQTGR